MSKPRRAFGRIRELPSGRFQASYVGPDGVVYTARTPANRALTFDSYGLADKFLTRVDADIQRGVWQSPSGRSTTTETFREFATRWLAARPIRATTREHYGELLRNHVLPAFGDVALTAITPEHVERWHAREAKPTAKAHAYALMRTILGTAVDRDLIAKNPCRIRGGGSAPTVKSMETAPSPAQIEALVEALPKRYRAMALLAVWCSARFGEIVALERADLDLEAGIVWIRKGVTSTKSEGLRVGDPKTRAGRRPVTIPRRIVPALREHVNQHAGPVLVFPAVGGGYMAGSTLWKVYGPATKAAGLEGLTFHNLRGVGQTYAANAGANLRELMNRAGQVSPEAALRYLGEVDGRQREIADRLDGLAATPPIPVSPPADGSPPNEGPTP